MLKGMRRSHQAQAVYEEARRLRAKGLSLAQIGESMGFSKQYAAKLLKSPPVGQDSSTAASTRQSTESANQLTPRQRRFAQGLLEGKTQKDAALEAVEPGQVTDGSVEQWASRTVRNPQFKQSFDEILRANGLADEDLARVHRENLEATKVVGWETDEQGRRRPLLHSDYAVRQRAVVDGWRVRGRMTSKPIPELHKPTPLVFLTPEQAAKFEMIAPLRKDLRKTLDITPDEIQEIVEEEGWIPRQDEDEQPPAEPPFDSY